jgi:hypothetical protein
MSIVIAYLTTEIRHRWQAVRATKDGGYRWFVDRGVG